VYEAVDAATQEVLLMMFYLDIRGHFLKFTRDPPTEGVPTGGSRLEDALLVANVDDHCVVKLLIRRASPIIYPFHPADTVEAFFRMAPFPHTVVVREYATDFRLPMHAKLIICDGKAHIIGSPFVQEYFDGSGHLLKEPRRGPVLWSSSIKVPVHDVGL